MTKQQYKLCKAVIRYKYLTKILKKTKINSYIKFQENLSYKLNFSDSNMDSKTIVSLQTDLQEAYETYRARIIDTWITRGLALSALLISMLALLSEIGILRLPQG